MKVYTKPEVEEIRFNSVENITAGGEVTDTVISNTNNGWVS